MPAEAVRGAPYYAPRKTTTLKRQAECLAFAANKHGHGFWSYLARFSDITAYQMKGWPEPLKWLDLCDALDDGAETLALIAELARLKGDRALLDELRCEIERLQPRDPAR